MKDRDRAALKVANLFVNARSTDTRMDERRSDINMFNRRAALRALRGHKKLSSGRYVDAGVFGGRSESDIGSLFLNAVSSIRLQKIGERTPIDTSLIGPDIEKTRSRHVGSIPQIDQQVFWVTKRSGFFNDLGLRGARYGWEDYALNPFEDGLSFEEVRRRWMEIDLADRYLTFNPGDYFEKDGRLTWLTTLSDFNRLERAPHLDGNSADRYRDHVGLGHVGAGTECFGLEIPGRLISHRTIYRPRYCDNPNYIWFMVGSTTEPRPKNVSDISPFGQTCCLRALDKVCRAKGDGNLDGVREVVALDIELSDFQDAQIRIKHLGRLSHQAVSINDNHLKEKVRHCDDISAHQARPIP